MPPSKVCAAVAIVSLVSFTALAKDERGDGQHREPGWDDWGKKHYRNDSPLHGVVVKDSNGIIAGAYFYSPFSGEAVGIKTSTGTIFFSLFATGTSPSGEPQLYFSTVNTVSATGRFTLYYTSTDCTGTPYTNLGDLVSPRPIGTLQISDGVKFYPIPSNAGGAANVVIQSFRDVGPPYACILGTPSDPNTQLTPVTGGKPLASLGLTPPFTISVE